MTKTNLKGASALFASALALLATLPAFAAIPSGQTRAVATPNTNLQYGFTMALLGNNVQVRSMGFQWVMYTVGWDTAEPTQGAYDWGDTNNIVNYAQGANVNVLIRVSRSPAWARDPSCAANVTCPPADPRTFGDFMGAMAAHIRYDLGPTVRVAFELWNEPNTDQEWGGLCPDAARYTGMLRAAYPRIKAAFSGATVVGGALTTVGAQPLTTCFVDDIVYLRSMYAAGAAPYFDVLSDHPYGFTNPPEADPSTTQPALVFRRAEQHRDVMVQFGDTAKQIWATEIGWAMDPRLLGEPCNPPDWYFIYNQQQQADYLVRAFQWARSYWPWMGAVFVFNFDFNEAPWYSQCHPFRFWSVKDRAAQQALTNFALNPPPTYTPVVDNAPAITAVRYSSLGFNRNGGTLIVDVDVTDMDSTPVESVNAILQYPGGGTQLFALTLVSGSNTQGTWRTSMPIPPNSSAGTETYLVSPYAVETAPPRRTTNAPPQQIVVTNTRFWDVPQDYWAYNFIEYLANAGVISGYSDNSFRPANNATRGQFSKMVVIAEGWPINTAGGPHFVDVPTTNPFYDYIETAFNRAVISGYADGTFRPGNNITRAQIAKVIVNSEGWPINTAGGPHFIDVAPTHAFYGFIETSYNQGVISGYADSTFRPGNNATRAQISKMLYIAVTSGVPTPTPGALIKGPSPTPTALPK